MIEFMQVRPNGEIVMQGECPESQLKYQKEPGCRLVLGDGRFDTHFYDWIKKETVLLPPKPSDYHWFDYDKKMWVIRKEEALLLIRSERDKRIAESDWVLLDDVPLSDGKRNEWKIYRQKLRDITKTPNLGNLQWPVKPK